MLSVKGANRGRSTSEVKLRWNALDEGITYLGDLDSDTTVIYFGSKRGLVGACVVDSSSRRMELFVQPLADGGSGDDMQTNLILSASA